MDAVIHEARRIALSAVERGLLDAQAVWEIAFRCGQGGAGSTEELLGGALTAEQRALLDRGDAANEPDEKRDTRDERTTNVRIEVQDSEQADGATTDEPALFRTRSPSDGPISLDGLASAGDRGARYEMGPELGTGGSGKVVRALDRETGRTVAMKLLQRDAVSDPAAVRRFVEEARVTAQLEHPNIIPVYDLGEGGGRPYYTMRVVKRQSLYDVLKDPKLREQWPLARLVGAFAQVSRALDYAHKRGVIHRDIKPENILVGDFGEVYIADWGIAKLVDKDAKLHSLNPPPGSVRPPRRRATSITGTPGYIAPEQIRGQLVDHRVDIFALGVVLYEMLTGTHPFDINQRDEVLVKTVMRDPAPPRTLVRNCPLLLEDLCLSMLAKDPAKRPASAEIVAAEAEAFLEGAKEKERRREEAKRLCKLAEAPRRRDLDLARTGDALRTLARKHLEELKGHEPIDAKRPGWELEDRAAEIELEQARTFARAIELYTQALAYDPECDEARAGLAELYYARAVKADQERRHATRVYYEALVADLKVGTYPELFAAGGTLTLESNPPGAEVYAYRYRERDRVLVEDEERRLGVTPIENVTLAPGSYLLVVKHPGFRDVRYPVLLGRGGHHRARVNLYTDDEIGSDFVYVPAGAFIAGGDPDAYDALPRTEPFVDDFAIARFPVTFREYCAFIDDLEARDPALALRRAPRDMSSTRAYYVERGPTGAWQPTSNALEGDARKLFPPEDGNLWKLPVFFVDWFDARAYCAWRSERDGATIRLPAELEWEKAARGTDGRFHPWGDRFDPTFCLMRTSRPFRTQPEPVGTFPVDTSPYGVRDMAGGMREWMGDIVGERTWDELRCEPEPTEGSAASWRVFRSGNWAAGDKRCRTASRARFLATSRYATLSFRLVRALPSRPSR